MMKKISLFMIFVIVILSCSCSNAKTEGEVSDVAFFRKVAREEHNDGWVYTFIYEDLKDENADDSNLLKYSFSGINVRYAYDEDYIQKRVIYPEDEERGEIITQIIYPSCLILGEGSDAEKSDMELIAELISREKSVEELLAIDPDDYEFKAVDKDMFFRLMHKALTGEPQKEGRKTAYWEKPAYAVMCEPAFLSGYKFQVSCLHSTGFVDVIYIDVLYEDSSSDCGYVQLSDIIDNNAASAEQNEVFQKIKQISEDIKGTDNYLINSESYKSLTVGEIDFSRLYTFLDNIHNNALNDYIKTPRIETVKGAVE